MDTVVWKKCNSCKGDIPYRAEYFTCSVSTCNQKPFNYVFCSVSCFERHLPGARHKDAAAINQKAPAFAQVQPNSPARRIITGATKPTQSTAHLPKDTLIVVSKLKDYVKAKGGMNTAGNVAEVLSEIVRKACDKAIENAQREGRKTLMDRDFK